MILKIIKGIIISLIVTNTAWSQASGDSLIRVYNNAHSIDKKAEVVLDIVTLYSRVHPDSTAKYLAMADLLTQKVKDKGLRAKYLLKRAGQLQNLGEFQSSIDYNHKAIELYQSLNDIKGLANAYNVLGLTYKKNSGDNNQVLEFSKKALEYENIALKYYLQTDDADGLLRVYSNIGIIHRDIKEFKKAESSYLEGIKLAKKMKYEGYSLGILKANLSQIYLDYYKDFDKAIVLLKEAIVIYQKNRVRTSMEHAYRNISYNYTAKGNYVKAIQYANMAIEIAEEVKNPHRQIMAYSSLHHAQKKAGMYEQSLLNLEKANGIEDSLLSVEKSNMIAETNARFETVKKDAEIQVLNKNQQLSTWKIWTLVAGLLAVIGFAISLILKRKRDLLIYETDQALERSKREKAEQELDTKKKELTAKVLQLAHKNEFLTNLELEVNKLKSGVDANLNVASGRISKMIKRDIDSDKQWEQFSLEFGSIHKGFLSRLSEKFGTFTKTEVRLISLLKMNLNSKEIADTMGISSDGVKKARYRLRKKLQLDDAELQGYLLSF